MTLVAPAPPAVVVKANVAAQLALPATRSAVATLNVTAVTAPPITPELTPAADAVTSMLVCTVTAPAGAAAPMVRPVSVTVYAVFARIPPLAVKTMEVAPGAAGVSVAWDGESGAAAGVAPTKKKPDG